MSASPLSADEHDALREVVNVAMGRASAALGTLLDRLVMLQIPEIGVVQLPELNALIAAARGPERELTVVRQSFFGTLSGEAIALHAVEATADLAARLGYDAAHTPAAERACLLDVSNLMMGSMLGQLARHLELELTCGAPTLLHDRVRVAELTLARDAGWDCALLTRVMFQLEDDSLTSDLLVLMPDASLNALRAALARLLALLD